jgi:fructose-specific phosphotransferase system component IIB
MYAISSLAHDKDKINIIETIGNALVNYKISARDVMAFTFMVLAHRARVKEDKFETIGIA